jgi:hypothetical protein
MKKKRNAETFEYYEGGKTQVLVGVWAVSEKQAVVGGAKIWIS